MFFEVVLILDMFRLVSRRISSTPYFLGRKPKDPALKKTATKKPAISKIDKEIKSVKPSKKFTDEHLFQLHYAFNLEPYPKKETLADLMAFTGATKKQITGWFDYERSKHPEIIDKRYLHITMVEKLMEEKGHDWYPAKHDILEIVKASGQEEKTITNLFEKRRWQIGKI